jgi:hypothetical protein
MPVGHHSTEGCGAEILSQPSGYDLGNFDSGGIEIDSFSDSVAIPRMTSRNSGDRPASAGIHCRCRPALKILHAPPLMRASIYCLLAHILLIPRCIAEDAIPYIIKAKDRDIRSFIALYEHLIECKVVGAELVSGRATLIGNYKSKSDAAAAIESLLEKNYGVKLVKSEDGKTVTVTIPSAKEK